jgi:hypothetical protein
MKHEIQYHQLLQDKDARVRYFLGKDEQPEECKIRLYTIMSYDSSKIYVKMTQDQIDHNFRHATAVAADRILTKASEAMVSVMVEDQNFCHAARYTELTH